MLPLGSFARKDLTSCLPYSAAMATCRDFGSSRWQAHARRDARGRRTPRAHGRAAGKVTNLRDFYTVEYDYPDFHLSMECYYCSLTDESDEPQKHDRQLDIRWIPRTSLATVEWMPADKGLIDALIELKEDRLEANSTAKDVEAATTEHPPPNPSAHLSAAARSVPSPACSTASIPRTSPLTSANWSAVAPPSKSP